MNCANGSVSSPNIYKKLFLLRKDCPTIVKSETAKLPKYSYQFAPLSEVQETIIPLMETLNLFHHWWVDGVTIYVRVIDLDSGEFVESSMKLDDDHADFQEVGKCLTYYSRYLLLLILGLVAEKDDDGNSSKRYAGTKKRPPARIQEDEDDEDEDDEDEDEDDEPAPRRSTRRRGLPTRRGR